MVAPTPLSAYTDGLAATWHALGWAAGALTLLTALATVLLLLLWAIQPAERVVRRRYTSWRLHREHTRSGRG